ncbi:Uncharacterised protein [Mycoplasmopsis californica]|uniref:Glycosyltransferase 2-like domain-containing protein n=1 Tax=Mycoplasmopsis equigenitalium TaxID=114883 RepID=A0ABY5J2J2_9BACT|nr:hypothetical protein [Mycoplasmopsis equigenitalium]UUD36746.1 hypothetical protein NPA09_02480 [Mycoplasmopsis equigenitalium]VEU69960.1 Uncharacterised protein [Mycoplasmopsis californica]
MKLSIIGVVNTKITNISDYLKAIANQNNDDFELILIIQKVSDKLLNQLDNIPKELKDKTTIISNYKDLSMEYLMLCGLRIAKGEYISFVFPNSVIRPYTTQVFIDDINKYNTDIIEYKPRLIGDVRWKPSARLDEKVTFDSSNPIYVALAFPFIFNKLFKNELVQKVLNIKEKLDNNSKFSIELLYYLLFNAKSYKYNDYRVLREIVDKDFVITPNTFKSVWEDLEKYLLLKEIRLNHELKYARFYYSCILTPGLLSGVTFWNLLGINTKSNRFSKLNLEKTDKFISKLFDNEFSNFGFKNKYMSLGLIENELMKNKIPQNEWKKILKVLHE